MQHAIGEPGPMQRGPEAVPRTGEVMAGVRCIQTWIDAAEQYAEAGRDHIADRAIRGCLELRARWESFTSRASGHGVQLKEASIASATRRGMINEFAWK